MRFGFWSANPLPGNGLTRYRDVVAGKFRYLPDDARGVMRQKANERVVVGVPSRIELPNDNCAGNVLVDRGHGLFLDHEVAALPVFLPGIEGIDPLGSSRSSRLLHAVDRWDLGRGHV